MFKCNIYLIFRLVQILNLQNSIQRPVKSSLSVHVLSVFPLERHMNISGIVTLHFLILSRIKTTDPHDLHHLDLLVGFPLKVLLRQDGRLGDGDGVLGPALAAARDPLP